MLLAPLRWLGRNFGTLLVSFLLAVLVWVSAVVTADPNEECALPYTVSIEIVGKDPNMLIMDQSQDQVSFTFYAPRSVCQKLESDRSSVRAWVNLSGLGAGVHDVPVQDQISMSLVRKVRMDPETIQITLEVLETKEFTITLVVSGEPPLAYKAETPVVDPGKVSISGPASLVDKIKEARANLDISGATETIRKTVSIVPVDDVGKLVTGVTLTPSVVSITQTIDLLGGYRNVIVKVVTTGQVASGYRLTNYFATPSSVIVFSSDPQLVNSLPGYIETKPVDLSNASDDFESLVELNLPEGVSVLSDSKVLVQVSIAAIESSMTISLPVEITGLAPGLEAEVAPSTVDVLLSGPVPELNKLQTSDVRVKVDLTGFGAGVYQIIPVVDLLPTQVKKASILPATVEVNISLAPTATPTITPTPSGSETPTLSPNASGSGTETPTITPTRSP